MLTQIELKKLWKFYSDTPVLRNINYTFLKGETYLVSGANGSGKTSLLSILAGLTSFDEGTSSYELESKTYTKTPDFKYLAHGVGERGLYYELSVIENMKIFLSGISSLFNEKFTNEHINSALDFFKIGDFKNSRISSLSNGFKQRVYLSIIFSVTLFKPSVWLILDEPDVFLDDNSLSLLNGLILQQKNSGGTCILTSHNSKFLSNISHRLLSIDSGFLEDKS